MEQGNDRSEYRTDSAMLRNCCIYYIAVVMRAADVLNRLWLQSLHQIIRRTARAVAPSAYLFAQVRIVNLRVP